eukprot:396620_1
MTNINGWSDNYDDVNAGNSMILDYNMLAPLAYGGMLILVITSCLCFCCVVLWCAFWHVSKPSNVNKNRSISSYNRVISSDQDQV